VGRKAYSPEFKAQVTKEAIETNNTALVASKHGLAQKTVYNWFSKEINKGANTKKKDLKALEKKNQELELENRILKELLKKTTNVLVKD
jgi:transposase-like protein